MRVLVRDFSELRTMQDGIVEQIQQTTPVPIAGSAEESQDCLP